MTTVERLIRTICEGQRVKILQEQKDDPRLQNTREDIPFRKLSPVVRNAFHTIVKLEPRIKRAKKTIERYGFSSHTHYSEDEMSAGGTPYRVRRNSSVVDAEIKKRRDDYARRLRTLEILRSSVHVECLGKTPEEAKPLLKKLQQQVEKL